jgi:hypothetical protein
MSSATSKFRSKPLKSILPVPSAPAMLPANWIYDTGAVRLAPGSMQPISTIEIINLTDPVKAFKLFK